MIKTSEKVKLDQLNQLNHQRGGGVGGRQQQSYSQECLFVCVYVCISDHFHVLI